MKMNFLNVVNCRHDWKYVGLLNGGLLAVQLIEYKCSKCHSTKTEMA